MICKHFYHIISPLNAVTIHNATQNLEIILTICATLCSVYDK